MGQAPVGSRRLSKLVEPGKTAEPQGLATPNKSAGSADLGPLAIADVMADTTLREWSRATQFMALFAVSGWLAEQRGGNGVTEPQPLRPASVMLVGSAGSGKTELIRRFRTCQWISYHSDLTVRPLLGLLRKAEAGAVTHIGAEEFNKFFQRKASVAENCIGLLSSAMEEGVSSYSVGPVSLSFDFARLGLFAGMTPGTLARRRELLAEMGFLSRACVLEWHLRREERDIIMEHMNRGDDSDLRGVLIPIPKGGVRAVVEWDKRLGSDLQDYVRQNWPENDLRIFQRFRSLVMAHGYLCGRVRAVRADLDALLGFHDYWKRMVLE